MHCELSTGHIKQFAQLFSSSQSCRDPIASVILITFLSQWSDTNLFGIIPGFRLRRQKSLTSGESVSVEEPRIERILSGKLLTRKVGMLARQAKEGGQTCRQGGWRSRQS